MISSFNNFTFSVLLGLAWMLGVSQPTSAADGRFVNLSTRALVETGDEVMVGGFIIKDGPLQVLIQARGPELANGGIPNALADPILTVLDTTANPVALMVNDNWEDTQGQLVSDLWGGNPPLAPGSLSSAAVLTLAPGNYAAKVEGKNGSAGVAIVEFFAIDSPDVDPPPPPPPPEVSSDREALEIFYDATSGDYWTFSDNWLTDAPLSEWHGVETDSSGRVVSLIITHDDGFDGPIPPELGNLSNLQILNLSEISLRGSIPPELGNLSNLQTLEFFDTYLRGPIPPELGNLENLQTLELVYNNMSGSIPPELGNLSSLQTLRLSISLLSGSIPPELGNLTELTSLSIYGNLSGPIPPQLGNLSNLEFLSIGGNLSGPIPPQLGNLSNLKELYLRNNQLSGSIPPELGNLSKLHTLDLRGNMVCVPDDATLRAFLNNLTSLPACE